MNQLTIRKIPDSIRHGLITESRKTGTSVNKTVIELLGKSLGIQPTLQKRRDLSDLAGTWTKEEAEEFDKATKCFEEIDKEMWD